MSHGTPYQSPEKIYQAYISGHISPDVAVQDLAWHYKDIDEFIDNLDRGRKSLREMIEELVDHLPERKAIAAGYDIAIVASSESVSWDTKALDAIFVSLMATGDVDMMRVASQIGLARTVSRDGESLRIVRQKEEQDAE